MKFSKNLRAIVSIRERLLKNPEKLHVRLQNGTRKTGNMCFTVSLVPGLDCGNCDHCFRHCYDEQHDCIYPATRYDRAKNSAIHKADRERYWHEISLQVKANYVSLLRLNVGGDLENEDFPWVAWLCNDNPRCQVMFFTKNYEGAALLLDTTQQPENMHMILSAWPGLELYNPHNIPVAHVLFPDGTTTAPEFGAIYCKGNCTGCAYNDEGCWTLQPGDHVIFHYH